MEHSLINPNQLRSYGVKVWDNSYDDEREFGISLENVLIPFATEGAIVHFDSHYPSDNELENCTAIHLTSREEWDPHNITLPKSGKRQWFDDNEIFIGKISRNKANNINRDINQHETDMIMKSICGGYVEQELAERMIARVRIGEVHSKGRHSTHSPEHIAKIFRIGLDKAKMMLERTTQLGIRQSLHPLVKRYRVDRINNLHANDLGGKWAMDHMHSSVKSIRGHTGAFVISNGALTEAYPKPTKDQFDGASSLNTFIQDVGVPTPAG